MTLGAQQRLTAPRTILVEDRAGLQARVLAGLVRLFAQPVNRLTRLTVDDVDLLSPAPCLANPSRRSVRHVTPAATHPSGSA